MLKNFVKGLNTLRERTSLQLSRRLVSLGVQSLNSSVWASYSKLQIVTDCIRNLKLFVWISETFWRSASGFQTLWNQPRSGEESPSCQRAWQTAKLLGRGRRKKNWIAERVRATRSHCGLRNPQFEFQIKSYKLEIVRNFTAETLISLR